MRPPERRIALAVGGAVAACVAAALLLVSTGPVETPSNASEVIASPAPGFVPPDDVSPLPEPIGVAANWNGVAFIQDNLWTSDDAQYLVVIGPDGSPVAGRRSLPAGPWALHDLSTVADNPLASPTVADPHRIYAIGTDRAGGVHVLGNMHASRLRYVRSTTEDSITDWTTGALTGADESSMTYPALVRAGNGPLLLSYREGGSRAGDLLLDRFDESSGSWERVALIFSGRDRGASAYLNRIATDRDGSSLHLFLMRRGGQGPEANGPISYLTSDDQGVTWRGPNDQPVALPLDNAADATLPLDSLGPGLVIVNQGGAVIDEQGRPHAVWRVRGPDGNGVLHVYRDSDGWHHEVIGISRAIAGRPALVAGPGDGVSLLWTEALPDSSGTVWLSPLTAPDDPTTDGAREVPLVQVASGNWEPTYDSVAHDSEHRLAFIVPTNDAGAAAVVTYDLADHPTTRTISQEPG